MIDNLKNLVSTTLVRMSSSVKPKEDIWIFSSVDNRKFNYNSRYLFEYVRSHFPHITARFVMNDEAERKKLNAIYGEDCFIESVSKEGIKKVLEGGVWFTSAGLPVYGIGLLKNRKIYNLWHGVPLKKIALMENQTSFLYRLYFKWIFSANYTGILTTSESLVPIMAKSFGVEEARIKVWGQPRNDLLFQKVDKEEFLNRFYKDMVHQVKHIILYAPTYREFGKTRLFPFDDFNQEQLEEFLSEQGILLCIRYHLEEQEAGCSESKWIRTINEDRVTDIMEVLPAFDGIITDYSSIYIDYLLLERPLVFLPYDKEEYTKKRGINFEYDEVTPGPKPETLGSFMEEWKKLLLDSSYYKNERCRVNRFFNQIQEPCSDTIIKTIIKGNEENL